MGLYPDMTCYTRSVVWECVHICFCILEYIYRYIYHTYVNMCIIPSKTLFYCFVPFVKFQVWRLVAMSLMDGTRKYRTKAHSCQGSAIGGYRALLPVEFLMDRGMGGNCSSQRWWRCELSLHRGEDGREGNSGDSRGQISRSPKSRMQVVSPSMLLVSILWDRSV